MSSMEIDSCPQLDAEFDKELGAKLALIEEIRSVLDEQGIECPGVLVIGAQSSGKSSVLERLTGISFPRGENTCTRFPTIVQLQTDPKTSRDKALVSICAEFSDAHECESMKEVQNAILSCTEKVKSKSHPIADSPIHVRYIRKSGPVMTLIDLPGITHVDVKNDSFDIHAVTAGMVEKYVNNKNMVVLVVIPANDDFGNSEALSIARTFDIQGDRTIGVVSKCDLVPNSSDIVEKIRMTRDSDVKLALGFIAVRNKGPNEEGIDILVKEKELFSTHKVLRNLKPDEWGYVTLSRKIVQLQSSRVNRFIPEVRSAIRCKISDAETKLKSLGIVPSTSSEMRYLLSTALATLEASLLPLTRSESSDYDVNIASKTASFAVSFASKVRAKVPDFLSHEYHSKILKKMEKATGYSLPNFIGDTIFRDEIKNIFFNQNIPDNVRDLIDETAALMDFVFNKVIGEMSSLKNFPSLARLIMEECSSILYFAKNVAIQTTASIVHCESIQVFTVNQEYVSSINEAKEIISLYQLSQSGPKQKPCTTPHHTPAFGASDTRYNTPVNASDVCLPEKYRGVLPKEFVESYIRKADQGLLEQSTFDLQIALREYSKILMKRVFDIVPMLVRSTLVIDVVNMIHVKIQGAIADESLMIIVSDHASVLRNKQSIQNCIEGLKEAQEKLKAIN